MGIDKFFNNLKKLYGLNVVEKLLDSTSDNFSHLKSIKYFLIDFNSIIHQISNNISNSLVYLYHITCVANTYPNIYLQNSNDIEQHIMNLRTNIILESNIDLPDLIYSNQSNQSDQSNQSNQFLKVVNFKNLKLDDIDETFYNFMKKSNNLDKLIMGKIMDYICEIVQYTPNVEQLYLAIDGVPFYAKMIEQKKRRLIGALQSKTKLLLLEHYKLELNMESNVKSKIYYNQYEFELNSKKFKFNKSKISPGTKFMTNLQEYLTNNLSDRLLNCQIIIDPYENMGEGETKIVNHMLANIMFNSNILVYSPDADMILLMLLESDKFNIQIMRYDQQLFQLDLINIIELKKILIKHIGSNKLKSDQIISDICMLLTILGNDFLPKLEAINTNRHINLIFNAYKKTHTTIPIFNNQTGKISYEKLLHFFMNLKSELEIDKMIELKKFNKYAKQKPQWKLDSNQIVNSNAINYFKHWFEFEHMTNKYQYLTKSIDNLIKFNKIAIRKYLVGFNWLTTHYLKHLDKYKFFYYKYNYIPSIDDIICELNKCIMSKKLSNKYLSNLSKSEIMLSEKYFTPIQQLIFISAENIINIADPIYLSNLTNKFKSYDQLKLYLDKLTLKLSLDMSKLKITNNKVNINNYIRCQGTHYMSKCEFVNSHLIKPSGRKILKILNKN